MKEPRFGKAVTVLAILAGLSGPGLAGSEDVVIADAWARATIGMNRPGAAYLTLRNSGDADVTVTGLATPLAMMSEIHRTTTNADGVMYADKFNFDAKSRSSKSKSEAVGLY